MLGYIMLEIKIAILVMLGYIMLEIKITMLVTNACNI